MECTAESSCENGGSQAQPTREEERGGQGLVWQIRLSRNKRASPDLKDKPKRPGSLFNLNLGVNMPLSAPGSGRRYRNDHSNY